MKSKRSLCLATILLTFAAACGSSSSKGSTPSDVANKTFTGTLSNGALVTLNFGSAVAAHTSQQTRALVAATTLAVTGTITTGPADTIPLAGTYDFATGQFTVTGTGYSLTGAYASGTVQGSCTTPSGTAIFVAVVSSGGATVVTYCGTYSFTASGRYNGGALNLLVSGTTIHGVASDGTMLHGTVHSGTITLTGENGSGTVTGPITDTSVSGTIQGTDVTSGTFSCSTAACSAVPSGPACPTFANRGSAQLTLYTTEAAPSPHGGVVADGKYGLTDIRYYGAASGTDNTAWLSTLLVSSDQFQLVSQGWYPDYPEERMAGALQFSGTTITLTVSCASNSTQPVGSQLNFQYSSDGFHAFVLFDSKNGLTRGQYFQ
jgi:hypothetical protein